MLWNGKPLKKWVGRSMIMGLIIGSYIRTRNKMYDNFNDLLKFRYDDLETAGYQFYNPQMMRTLRDDLTVKAFFTKSIRLPSEKPSESSWTEYYNDSEILYTIEITVYNTTDDWATATAKIQVKFLPEALELNYGNPGMVVEFSGIYRTIVWIENFCQNIYDSLNCTPIRPGEPERKHGPWYRGPGV
jgi:hypothetical protein